MLEREEGAATTLRQLGATVRTLDLWDDPVNLIADDDDEMEVRPRALVFEALDRLMKGKTCIVIAHHLATIRSADIIFVVKDHHIAERGTHEELLAAGAFYAELYNIQFGEQPVAG